jgi:hypothetical protein
MLHKKTKQFILCSQLYAYIFYLSFSLLFKKKIPQTFKIVFFIRNFILWTFTIVAFFNSNNRVLIY